MTAPQGYGPPQGQPQYNGPQQYGPPQGQPPVQQGYGPPQNTAAPAGQQAAGDDSGFFTGGSGSPAISFPRGEFGVWKGGIYTGTISTKQATTMKTDSKPSTPRFWDSGDPVADVVVEVLSQDCDAGNPLDDGRRRMFVTQENTHIADSRASVTKEATRNGFQRGGQIYWRRTGERMGKQSMRGVWECSYTPPTAETLAVLDALAPQGVSQQAADQVMAQASYTQPSNGSPYQQPQGQPQPAYQQGPPSYQPAGQAGPPPTYGQPVHQQGYQNDPAGPPQQQGWAPPGTTNDQYLPQQGPPAQQQPTTGYQGQYDQGPPFNQPVGNPTYQGQSAPEGQPGVEIGHQQGQPHQTSNPYR